MITIRDWNDLRHYGINFLTGEACAVGKRLLCDVNEQGRKLICSILGLPINTPFAENWNSQVNGEDSVGSIFLPHHLFAFLSRDDPLADRLPVCGRAGNGRSVWH